MTKIDDLTRAVEEGRDETEKEVDAEIKVVRTLIHDHGENTAIGAVVSQHQRSVNPELTQLLYAVALVRLANNGQFEKGRRAMLQDVLETLDLSRSLTELRTVLEKNLT